MFVVSFFRNVSFGIIALLFLVSAAFADAINLDGDGVAIQGHDPVAYFTDAAAVPGSDDITAEHEGAIYKFASEEHRKLFLENPEKYSPQYGGYCAFAVAKGSKASIDPASFTIVDDKLYLNYNSSVLQTWRSDIPGNIAAADKNWPSISGSGQ